MDEINRKIGEVEILSLSKGVANQQRLFEFLKTQTPYHLEITVAKFDSSILNKLAECCQHLREIHIQAKKSANLSSLDFIFKLDNLASVHISNAFSMSFAIKMMETAFPSSFCVR